MGGKKKKKEEAGPGREGLETRLGSGNENESNWGKNEASMVRRRRRKKKGGWVRITLRNGDGVLTEVA